MEHVKEFLDMKGGGKGKYLMKIKEDLVLAWKFYFLSLIVLLQKPVQQCVYLAGIGYWSEQAFEAVHANFKVDWDTVKVDLGHKEYMERLTAAMSRYNSRHI